MGVVLAPVLQYPLNPALLSFFVFCNRGPLKMGSYLSFSVTLLSKVGPVFDSVIMFCRVLKGAGFLYTGSTLKHMAAELREQALPEVGLIEPSFSWSVDPQLPRAQKLRQVTRITRGFQLNFRMFSFVSSTLGQGLLLLYLLLWVLSVGDELQICCFFFPLF